MRINPLTEHEPIPEWDDEQRVGIFMEQSGNEATIFFCPKVPPSDTLVALPEGRPTGFSVEYSVDGENWIDITNCVTSISIDK